MLQTLRNLRPLFVIVGLITLVSYITATTTEEFMYHFMGGFFVVFAGFKLIDLKGFTKGYAKYDLLAKLFPPYGYLYALAELSLGLLYLQGVTDDKLHMATLGLMLFSGAGVVVATIKKLDVRCACLGTFINVPLTYVTVIEDFGMAAMAAWMLLT